MGLSVEMGTPTADTTLHSTANGHPRDTKSGRFYSQFSHLTLNTELHFSSPAMASDTAVSPAQTLSAMSSTNHSMSTLPESDAVDQPTTRSAESPPPPASLPQSAALDYPSPVVSSGSAMGEALSKANRSGSGLIRRLSRGAHNRLRRRASTTHTNRIRDQSAGPVLMRRRSDSNGASDFAGDVSDLELEPPSEDNAADNASSIVTLEPTHNGTMTPRRSIGTAFEGGIAPTISAVLEQGTTLIKVTKKKRKGKTLKFRLDTSAAKVCWDASNPAKQFYIDDVREIRVGAEARSSREDIQIPPELESCWMTIVYDVPDGWKSRSIKTAHLIAPNEYIVKLWTDALKTVERDRIEIMNALSSNSEKSQRSMAMAWKQAMARKTDNDPKVDFNDALFICRKLEINCSADAVRRHFNQADSDLVGVLNYPQYEAFISSFKVRKDVKALYDSIKPVTEPELNLVRFFDFLQVHQAVDVEKDRRLWEARFESLARAHSTKASDPATPNSAPPTMNLLAFQSFLSSSANGVLCGSSSQTTTLDRPLNEYFVSSSHNTYLLGRQVAGASSVEGYISALVKGCRCIEVDCWDGKDGRPVVNHGRTLSTEVLFEDCISVISKYAFASSAYPLIVSLEVHCNAEQQAVMTDIMIRHFGEALLTTPILPNSTNLPSPEELRNRILIKVKATQQQLIDLQGLSEAMTNGRRARSHSSPFSKGTPLESTNTWPLSPPLTGHAMADALGSKLSAAAADGPRALPSAYSSTTLHSNSSSSENELAMQSVDDKRKRKTSNIIPALGALGVYTCGIKYSGFGAPEARKYNHTYSFAENTFNSFCKDEDSKHQLEQHNVDYLMRVYPAARRIDSSNFNPLQAWRRGVQMAALNWQTYDVNLQVNEAMFAAGTDRTGYVLKPEELRQSRNRSITATETIPENQIVKHKRGMKFVKFSVEIISAQRLPRPRNQNPEQGMNPYIEFEMFSAEDRGRGVARSEGGVDASARDGTSGIGTPVRKRTKILEGNGFDPSWKENISMTVETKYPSLIFVRWTVWNSPDGRSLSPNSTMLATFTAKLSSLQQGYRHLPLFNSYGERYRDAKLFVKITKDDPILLQNNMHKDDASAAEQPADHPPVASPRADKEQRSWSRKLFSRPGASKKSRDPSPSPFGTFSRTSSMERPGP